MPADANANLCDLSYLPTLVTDRPSNNTETKEKHGPCGRFWDIADQRYIVQNIADVLVSAWKIGKDKRPARRIKRIRSQTKGIPRGQRK